MTEHLTSRQANFASTFTDYDFEIKKLLDSIFSLNESSRPNFQVILNFLKILRLKCLLELNDCRLL